MTTLRFLQLFCVLFIISLIGGACTKAPAPNGARPHNVILFVADGLRAKAVTKHTAPTMATLRDDGVDFVKPHSLYPTITMANASGLSTGHFIGDTGTVNNLYTATPITAANDSVTPFLESDLVLGQMDQNNGGNFMNEETLLAAANKQGFSTAAIGKLGPALLFDHAKHDGQQTIVIDDSTGNIDPVTKIPQGVPLDEKVRKRLNDAKLGDAATLRQFDNASSTSGATAANIEQQNYFVNAATQVVLPLFKEQDKPFMLVFWSRDPDGTQHNQVDKVFSLTPGINGPTSLAAIKNADNDLDQLQQWVNKNNLQSTTDIIVVADHGFSTISKEREKGSEPKEGLLPPGFVALDLKDGLKSTLNNPKLYDPDDYTILDDHTSPHPSIERPYFPSKGNGLIGNDVNNPDVVVVANGGSDTIYLPTPDKDRNKKLAEEIVGILASKAYTSGIFVSDELGPLPGTLPFSSVNLKGSSPLKPTISIVVSFRSEIEDCDTKVFLDNETPGDNMKILCTAGVADSNLKQGQGNHGSFSRADTMNFMAAKGPDFKEKFVDDAPVSNADIGRTIASLLGLNIQAKGNLIGRIITEAQPNGQMPEITAICEASEPLKLPNNQMIKTILSGSMAGGERYFDAAGFPGRTVDLSFDKGTPSDCLSVKQDNQPPAKK